MNIVIDCSYVMACVMPDEERPSTQQSVLEQDLIVPFIWPVEVANAMRSAMRRKRLDDGAAARFVHRISALFPKVVAPWHDDMSRYLALANAHELTAYDAIYLDLCLTERSALATCDAGLARAAARAGIRTHS